jgi:acetyltransferase EpsM
VKAETPELILLGGGGHAHAIAESWTLNGGTIRGFLAPTQPQRASFGLAWLGDDEAISAHSDAAVVLGFGGFARWRQRSELVSRLDPLVGQWATVVHPTAWIAPSAAVERGTVVFPLALLHSGARVGEHCVVNSGAIIEHGVEVGPHVHVAPGVVIGGGTRIGANAFIGLGAKIRDNITIGPGAVIAMGAVVVRSVAAGERLAGIPAR